MSSTLFFLFTVLIVNVTVTGGLLFQIMAMCTWVFLIFCRLSSKYPRFFVFLISRNVAVTRASDF